MVTAWHQVHELRNSEKMKRFSSQNRLFFDCAVTHKRNTSQTKWLYYIFLPKILHVGWIATLLQNVCFARNENTRPKWRRRKSESVRLPNTWYHKPNSLVVFYFSAWVLFLLQFLGNVFGAFLFIGLELLLLQLYFMGISPEFILYMLKCELHYDDALKIYFTVCRILKQ